ncbi:MAG: hypothetical protein ACPGQR_06270 [Marinirhabdus sp.]
MVSGAVHDSLLAHGLSRYVKNLGYIDHNAALREMQASQVLLLLEMNTPETRAIIPGKLFEYMATKRPIVALGPKGSAIESVLKEAAAGRFFDHTEKKKLKAAIVALYDGFKNNGLPDLTSTIGGYHREALTERLSHILKNL